MNREQRKYFTDRLDSELNKAISALNARSEEKIKQLPNKCEALAKLMAKPQVRKAVCDAMEAFLSDTAYNVSIGDLTIYVKNRYTGCRSTSLDLSREVPEIQEVLDDYDNAVNRIHEERSALQTKICEAKLVLKDQVMFGEDAEKLLGQLTEFRNTVAELVNGF